MKKVLSQVVSFVKKAWVKEPARVISVAASVVVFVAAKFGIVLPTQSVVAALGFALPLVLGGELIRSQVISVGSILPPKV